LVVAAAWCFAACSFFVIGLMFYVLKPPTEAMFIFFAFAHSLVLYVFLLSGGVAVFSCCCGGGRAGRMEAVAGTGDRTGKTKGNSMKDEVPLEMQSLI
jgi:hypothetical protein